MSIILRLYERLMPLPIRLVVKHKGTFQQKLTYYKFAKLAASKGVIKFRVKRLADEYTEAFYGISQISKEDKLWAISKGLNPVKYLWYGMTRENASQFLSDFDFYKPSTYVDNSYLEFFENKLNTWLLLAPLKKYMPEHYWYIEDGSKSIMPLDVSNISNGSVDDLMKLIDTAPVAAKACRGGHGVGFYLLEKTSTGYAANRKELSKDEMINLLRSLKGYIFTEYNYPAHSIQDKIGKDSFAVMRLVTYYDEHDGAQIYAAMIRLGCKEAGVVTDYHGTIYCGIDLETGKTFKPIYRESDIDFKPIRNHPDTNVDLEGGVTIPRWSELKELVKSISRYLPFTPYLVMDIIPTDEGFAILEINSHGQIRNMEAHYPGLKNKYIRKHFQVKD